VTRAETVTQRNALSRRNPTRKSIFRAVLRACCAIAGKARAPPAKFDYADAPCDSSRATGRGNSEKAAYSAGGIPDCTARSSDRARTRRTEIKDN